jgi:hypothetical protein
VALCDFLAAAAMLQLTAVRTDLRGRLYAVTWGVCQGIRGTAYGTIVGDDCIAFNDRHRAIAVALQRARSEPPRRLCLTHHAANRFGRHRHGTILSGVPPRPSAPGGTPDHEADHNHHSEKGARLAQKN